MLVGNYSVPSTEIAPPLNYGDLDSFHELATGNFLLDSNIYLPIINSSSPITEFRFYCYKPSVGRVLHVTTDPTTQWGAYINRFILGQEEITPCQAPCGIRALSNDQSEMSMKMNQVGWGGIDQLFYGAVLIENLKNKHVYLDENHHDCDDNTNPSLVSPNTFHAGTWKFYLR